jgi:hypothetical protein
VSYSRGELPPALAKDLISHGVDPNKPDPPYIFEGARAGSNFVFSVLGSNDLQQATKGGPLQIDTHSRIVIGRAGQNLYQVGGPELRITTVDADVRNNSAARGNESTYNELTEVFHMGLGSLEERTVVWVDNEFTAKRGVYFPIRGELTVSNDLPAMLRVRRADNNQISELFSYSYPDPPNSLGGFPSRITRFSMTEDGWRPSVELDLLYVQIAKGPLPTEYFAASRFTTTSITFTNFYSNGVSYTVGLSGKVEKNLIPHMKQAREKSTHSTRVVVIFCLATISMIFLWLAATNHKKRNN